MPQPWQHAAAEPKHRQPLAAPLQASAAPIDYAPSPTDAEVLKLPIKQELKPEQMINVFGYPRDLRRRWVAHTASRPADTMMLLMLASSRPCESSTMILWSFFHLPQVRDHKGAGSRQLWCRAGGGGPGDGASVRVQDGAQDAKARQADAAVPAEAAAGGGRHAAARRQL